MVKVWKSKLAGIFIAMAVILAISAGALAGPRASIKEGHGALGVSLYSGTFEGGEELGTIPGFEIWGEYGLSKNAAVRGSYLSLDPLADTPLDPWVDASWNVGHLDLQLKLADNLAVFGGLQFQSLWIENQRFYRDTGGEVGLLVNVPLNLTTEFYGTLALASIEGDRSTDLGLGLDIRVSPAVYLGLAYKRTLDGWNGISGNLTYRF